MISKDTTNTEVLNLDAVKVDTPQDFKLLENVFSFFSPPITNVVPSKDITIEEVYSTIKSNKKLAILADKFKQDPDQKTFKTKQLPFVTFSAVFSEKRKHGNVKTYSGLIVIDIDKVSNTNELSEKVNNQDFKPVLVFVSPSGNGLKVIYRYDDPAKHVDYFKAISAYFRQEMDIIVDESGKDVPRACFLCHDPNAIYNDDATILDQSFIDTFTDEVFQPEKMEYPENFHPKNDLTNTIEACKREILSAPDGTKHNTLTKWSFLFGGLVSGGQLDEFEAKKILEDSISQRKLDSVSAAVRTIEDCVSAGKLKPIFKEDKPDKIKTSKKIDSTTPLLPVEVFPDKIQEWINVLTDTYGTHRDFWTSGFIAASTLAMGKNFSLTGKYKNYPLIWTVLIANSGSGKSQPSKVFLKIFDDIDSRNISEYLENISEYERIKSMTKKERDEEGVSLGEPPICKQIIFNDTTPEAEITGMKNNPDRTLVFSDEILAYFLNNGRYNKNGSDQARLSLWDLQSPTINRKGSSPIKLREVFNSMYGGIQESLLHELSKDNKSHNGALTRMCFVFPDKAERPLYSKKVVPTKLIDEYESFIKRVMACNDIPDLALSNRAMIEYERFFNENSHEINALNDDYLRSAYAKTDIIVLRLAIMLHVCNYMFDPSYGNEITGQTLQDAVKLCSYFIATQKKVHHKLSERKAGMNKKEVAKYLRTLTDHTGSEFNSQPDIAKVLGVSQPYINKILNE